MSILNSPPSNHPFSRGHSAIIGPVDSTWVRARASLNLITNRIEVVLGLETDRVDFGPIGQVDCALQAADGGELARVRTPEYGIDGKPPGGPRIDEFVFIAHVSPSIVARTKSLNLYPAYAGKQFGPFGIAWADVLKAVTVVIFG